jgi:phosphoglycolate phosphatase-like HAD superfamily hydrolase
MMAEQLSLWNDTPTKQAILEFVAKVTDQNNKSYPQTTSYVPPDERVAVFDNDGTLWSEKPVPVQIDFILRRLALMAEKDSSLRKQQPWKAAFEKDTGWFSDTVTAHYKGDDSNLKVLIGGVLKSFDKMTVDEFEKMSADFMHKEKNPSLGVSYMEVGFSPMVELLRYLEANDFTTYIASGGGRDFMRPITQTLYGIPPERVVGSAVKLSFQADDKGASVMRQAGVDFVDDGPAKPVGIWERIGRRPIFAAGNANGDVPMLQYTDMNAQASLCLLVNHDDADREFDYTAGAEKAMELAKKQSWTVVSVKQDWKQVFASKNT